MLNALKPITYKQTGALIPVIAALYSPIRVQPHPYSRLLFDRYGLLPLAPCAIHFNGALLP